MYVATLLTAPSPPTSSSLQGKYKYSMGLIVFAAHYFRPPFGTVGVRTRQRLSALLGDVHIINWSVDIEDWIWSGTDTPEKQLEAFMRDVERGGNLAVLHYLKPDTVRYFRDAIRFVKARGLHIMRVDQCLEDRDSPPLP